MQHNATDQAGLAEALARLISGFLASLPAGGRVPLAAFAQSLAAQPDRVAALQQRYYDALSALWRPLLEADAAAAAPAGDGSGVDWADLPFFRLLRESHRLAAEWLTELIELARLPADQQRRLRFVARQWVDASAPSNTPWTNPDVVKLAVASGGASLRAGLRNLAGDLARGQIAMSAPNAFEVGRNVAVTAGAVVHENDVVQLLQYAPSTPRVRARPLLIVPPFINKYYILDLRPENSFVRHALDQGLQVYLLSWRNASAALGSFTWDDYVRRGVLEAIDVVLDLSGGRSLNALGFCVGGTLLATALGVMDRPARVASLTLLASLLDYTDVGDIAVYVDRDYVEDIERQYAQGGIVPGARVAAAFASLRANDLVWAFVVNNYLMGRTPPAFDLLAWNGDSTNLPGPLYAWYLRHLYLENRLREPGGLKVLGHPVDLHRLTMPAYVLAAQSDHIVPWTSAYASAGLLAGRIEFVLGASGHVAGVVNPPGPKQRHYWHGPYDPAGAQVWRGDARRRAGSWWQHWAGWMRSRSGRWVPAPTELGSARHPVVELAPGRYVREPAAAGG